MYDLYVRQTLTSYPHLLGSVLTAPPRVRVRNPCTNFRRSTKAFTFISILSCFADNTFAAEQRVYGRIIPRERIDGADAGAVDTEHSQNQDLYVAVRNTTSTPILQGRQSEVLKRSEQYVLCQPWLLALIKIVMFDLTMLTCYPSDTSRT